ncbi:hypothetical protein Tco_1323545, partial [Tanacetum coccineum]
MNAPEKLTCQRTCQVRRHQNSEEAGMSKDISGSELLASSLCSGVKGQSDKCTVLVKDHCPWKDTKLRPGNWPRDSLIDFSLESSDTSDTHRQTRSTIKSRKTPSNNKELTHLRRPRRLEDQSTTREKARRERSKSWRKRPGHQETIEIHGSIYFMEEWGRKHGLKLNERSGEADLSKDMSGPEIPPELRRS